MKRLAIFFVALLCIGLVAQAQDFSQLDKYFDVLDEHHKYMGTMTITQGGPTVYQRAVGDADVASKLCTAMETKFRIGSITKAFTAVMIFQMIDEGRLSLDTRLSEYFPKVKNADKITIAHMLSHSSGLYNITNLPDFGQWMLEPSSRETMVDRIIALTSDFEPGEGTAYSNTNYILLGYIAEDIDGRSYSQILKSRIADRIGLANTYEGDKISSKNNEAFSYVREKEAWQLQPETDMSNPGGAGAIVSTSGDIVRFINALFAGELVSETSLEHMKKPSSDGEICHGIFYANMNGVEIYASEGSIDGFGSMLAHIPSAQTTVGLVTNGLNYSKIQIVLTAIGAATGQPVMIPDFNRIDITAEQAKVYEGDYASEEVPYKLIFKADGARLLGAPEQSDLKELTPTGIHKFSYEPLGIVLEFFPGIEAVRFTMGGNPPLMFKKV